MFVSGFFYLCAGSLLKNPTVLGFISAIDVSDPCFIAVMFALSINFIIFMCVNLLNLDKSWVKEKIYFLGCLITLR